ncbi:DedA family protein [Streptomyces sp. NPDC002589]|uniref:DedA family protein n=1 Tax=Streptomyces sp. NPDC002589 TaxID=3154420 RepID=UPI00331F7C51
MFQALNPLDATSLLTTLGTAGVFLVLFAETGLLIGFFLPGDSLLFTAGLLCTTTRDGVHLSLPAVLAASAAGALLGAQVGHLLGRRAGRAFVARTTNRHLANGVTRAEELLARYGHGKAIVLARFIPVVRTVLNPLAGIVGVPTRTFALWQVTGGLAWTAGLVLGGYALGSSIPNVDRYLLPLVGLIVVASLLPLALELLRARREGRAAEPDHKHTV